MANGSLLNFDKRYEDDLRVIFDQRPKLHLGLDALSNQKILKSIYFVPSHLYLFQFLKNIKNIAAARKVLKEVLKVSEDKKKYQ